MSEARDVYDFYKGSILLYFSIAFFTLTPLWPGWKARVVWGGVGLAAIIICWMGQSRKKLYLGNDYKKRYAVTQHYKISRERKNLILGAIFIIAFGASTFGVLKYSFGYYQFIGLSMSITMAFMGILNLSYLPNMRRHHDL